MKNALTGLDVGLEWTDGGHLCDADDTVVLDTPHKRTQMMTEARRLGCM